MYILVLVPLGGISVEIMCQNIGMMCQVVTVHTKQENNWKMYVINSHVQSLHVIVRQYIGKKNKFQFDSFSAVSPAFQKLFFGLKIG